MYICPICKQVLNKINNSYKCENNHSYDISSSGYVNLLNPGKRNNFKAGDSKEMVKARSAFFESNTYEPLATKLCSIISKIPRNVIVDAGCGEGYYSLYIAQQFLSSLILGFDMTKYGCDHASKCAKRINSQNALFSVANIFDLPLLDNSVDVVTSLFTPVADKEFSRILKPSGYLVVVSAGVFHLDGLKRILYDNLYLNEAKQSVYEGFSLIDTINLKYETVIYGNETINNLFTMTPYYHRTSLTDKKKLENITELSTNIEVNFSIYTKNN